MKKLLTVLLTALMVVTLGVVNVSAAASEEKEANATLMFVGVQADYDRDGKAQDYVAELNGSNWSSTIIPFEKSKVKLEADEEVTGWKVVVSNLMSGTVVKTKEFTTETSFRLANFGLAADVPAYTVDIYPKVEKVAATNYVYVQVNDKLIVNGDEISGSFDLAKIKASVPEGYSITQIKVVYTDKSGKMVGEKTLTPDAETVEMSEDAVNCFIDVYTEKLVAVYVQMNDKLIVNGEKVSKSFDLTTIKAPEGYAITLFDVVFTTATGDPSPFEHLYLDPETEAVEFPEGAANCFITVETQKLINVYTQVTFGEDVKDFKQTQVLDEYDMSTIEAPKGFAITSYEVVITDKDDKMIGDKETYLEPITIKMVEGAANCYVAANIERIVNVYVQTLKAGKDPVLVTDTAIRNYSLEGIKAPKNYKITTIEVVFTNEEGIIIGEDEIKLGTKLLRMPMDAANCYITVNTKKKAGSDDGKIKIVATGIE